MKKGGPSRAAGGSSKSGDAKTKPAAATTAAATAAATAASFGGEQSEAELREMRAGCPPDIEELGRYVRL
jgi:ribosomal protein S11